MQDYIIATSSTSDLTRTYLEEHQIPFVAYTYTVGDTLFEDDCREETRDRVYKGMRGGDRQGRDLPGHVPADVRIV